MNKMQAPEIEAVIRFAQAGLVALTDRVLTLLSLLGTMTMFGWVMLEPNWIRFAGACAFALLVLWPLMRHEAAKGDAMKFPYLSGPKKMGSDKTTWQTPGCEQRVAYQQTPKGKIQNTTYIYGRSGGQAGRKTSKPE